MQTHAIQAALMQLGYYLGKAGADGIWGRDTIAAFKLFQDAQKLRVTGVPDEAALKALFGQRTSVAGPEPVWFTEASRLVGVRETPGAASNPVIVGWAQKLSAWVRDIYTADAIPWCGLFVGHCISTTLPDERLPGNPLSALDWLKFGTRTDPAPGAVCVFHRKGGGHVGFYVGEDDEAIHVLGGNQSDAVTVARVPRIRLAGMRWPVTAPTPSRIGAVLVGAAGALSRNEA